MPTGIDHLAFLILVVAHATLLHGKIVRRLARRRRRVRFTAALSLELGGVAVVLLAWFAQGRSLGAFGLGIPATWFAWTGVALAIGWSLVILWITTDLHHDGARCDACRAEAFTRFGKRPATKRARSSITIFGLSGVTEEIVFRGFLILYLTSLLDLFVPSLLAVAAAVVLAAIAFASGHAHQGRRAAVATLFAGLVLGTLTVLTGSLWPAIIAHVAQNLAVSTMAFRLALLPPPAPDAEHTTECGGAA